MRTGNVHQLLWMGLNMSKSYEREGGEVVTVKVTVNNILVCQRSAALADFNPAGQSRYTTDNGKKLNHNRNRGYKELGERLLRE